MTQRIRIGKVYNGGSGEPLLQDKIITPSTIQQTIVPDAAYDGLSSVVIKAIPVVPLSTPELAVNSSGLIVSNIHQQEGYVSEDIKSSSLQLNTYNGGTITPSQTDKVIPAKVYTLGDIVIPGDENLKSENIAVGVSIFGVYGSHIGDSSNENRLNSFIKNEVENITASDLAGVR